MAETPQIAKSTYAASAFSLNEQAANNQAAALFGTRNQQAAVLRQQLIQPEEEPMPPAPPVTARRLVQVIIVDPDANVPLKDCLLYKGDLQLTDLTDQELFFDIDIKAILDAHNQKRASLKNKAVKERTELLEPARIRDLRMQIVTVAQF